jgi:hypothetical protein
MLILCAIIGVLLCLTCFFFVVVHPLICIVQCAVSKNLSGGQKALWIFLSFFVGIIGSLPYALFASGSTRIRSLTLNAMKLGALNLLLAIGVFAATPEIRDGLSVSMGDASMQSVVFDSKEMTDSLGEISAILDEQSNSSSQAEQSRFVSIVDPAPIAENTLASKTLAENAPKLENDSENISFLDDLVEDTAEVGNFPERSWSTEENAEDLVTYDGTVSLESTVTVGIESTVGIDAAVTKSLESETTTDNAIASKPQESLLPTRDAAETETTDVVPSPQTERRDTQPAAVTKLEKPSQKKPINRYRTEGYDGEQIALPNNTMPQPPTVRNRYKNP